MCSFVQFLEISEGSQNSDLSKFAPPGRHIAHSHPPAHESHEVHPKGEKSHTTAPSHKSASVGDSPSHKKELAPKIYSPPSAPKVKKDHLEAALDALAKPSPQQEPAAIEAQSLVVDEVKVFSVAKPEVEPVVIAPKLQESSHQEPAVSRPPPPSRAVDLKTLLMKTLPVLTLNAI